MPYTSAQKRRDRSGDVVHSSWSSAARRNRSNTTWILLRTVSASTSCPSRRRISANRSGNVGCGWTSVSPASKKTAVRLTARKDIGRPRSAVARRPGSQLRPQAVDLALEVLERAVVVDQDVGGLRL